jgi:hypothetical protein
MKESLAVSYETKYILSIKSSNDIHRWNELKSSVLQRPADMCL